MISILATLTVAFATHTVHHKKHHPAPVTLTGDPWTTSDVWYKDHNTWGREYPTLYRAPGDKGCGAFTWNPYTARCEYTIQFSSVQNQGPVACIETHELEAEVIHNTTLSCWFDPNEDEGGTYKTYSNWGPSRGPEDEHVESFRSFYSLPQPSVDNCTVFTDFSTHTTITTCTSMSYAEPMWFTPDDVLRYWRYGHGDYVYATSTDVQ